MCTVAIPRMGFMWGWSSYSIHIRRITGAFVKKQAASQISHGLNWRSKKMGASILPTIVDRNRCTTAVFYSRISNPTQRRQYTTAGTCTERLARSAALGGKPFEQSNQFFLAVLRFSKMKYSLWCNNFALAKLKACPAVVYCRSAHYPQLYCEALPKKRELWYKMGSSLSLPSHEGASGLRIILT